MRRSMLACGLLLALAGMSTAVAAAAGAGVPGLTTGTPTTKTSTTTTTSSNRAGGHSAFYWRSHLRKSRAGAQRWLTVIRGRPPRGLSRTLASHSAEHLRALALLWHRREHQDWRRAEHPPLLRDWTCIHHYEGSWTDHGAPYWGGLQMDYSFQSTYGGWLLRHKGTADHWSSLEQIWAAVRAWRVRGFSPWPNTARDCGV